METPVDKKNVAVNLSPPASFTSEIPKKSFLQELKPWSSIHPEASFISLLLRPWPLVVYPAVIYSFATFSSTQAWAICLLNTHASIFQRPPYNMTPGINSLIYISTIVGITLGSYCGGALTDRIAEYFSRRNKGVFEPESRLVALVLPFFIVPAGILMYVPLSTD
jgi:MFS family permease